MIYDLAILGGGPAGVAAGVYAARKKLKTIFITKNWESQSAVSEGIENWIGTVKISGGRFCKSTRRPTFAHMQLMLSILKSEKA
jgi:thioredoxin reductase